MNIREKWVPELRHHQPNTPIILVATLVDLRNDPETIDRLKTRSNTAPVSTAQGQSMATEINAVFYAECSALKYGGIDELVEAAALVGLYKKMKTKKKKTCSLL